MFLNSRYLRLPVEEVEGLIIENSIARHDALKKFSPTNKDDVIDMLGDQSGCGAWVYQDYDKPGITTIATGMFLS